MVSPRSHGKTASDQGAKARYIIPVDHPKSLGQKKFFCERDFLGAVVGFWDIFNDHKQPTALLVL